MPARAVAIVLHDVSPVTWTSCERMLNLVAALGEQIPVTLLVVPRFHGHPSFEHDRVFRSAIDARLSQGDELALHGLTHVDEGPTPLSASDWFARRVLTAGEAEFAALDAVEARGRIAEGLALFGKCGWTSAGFVPPAWQIGAAALAVLAEFRDRLSYTSTLNTLSSLAEGRAFNVPCLGYSARSPLRRLLSIGWNRLRYKHLAAAPLIRVALHPIDGEHENTLRAWRSLLEQVLKDRKPVTKSMLLQSAMRLSLHQRPMMPRREPAS